MAYIVAPFYDVSADVGQSRLNYQTDVMLVQYFLYYTFVNSGVSPWPVARVGNFHMQGSPAALTRSGGGSEVARALFPFDGIFRAGLTEWIGTFQENANEIGWGPIVVDGVVVHGGVGWGQNDTDARKWTTIRAFNHSFFLRDKDRFLALSTDIALPPSVKKDLQLVTSSDLSRR